MFRGGGEAGGGGGKKGKIEYVKQTPKFLNKMREDIVKQENEIIKAKALPFKKKAETTGYDVENATLLNPEEKYMRNERENEIDQKELEVGFKPKFVFKSKNEKTEKNEEDEENEKNEKNEINEKNEKKKNNININEKNNVLLGKVEKTENFQKKNEKTDKNEKNIKTLEEKNEIIEKSEKNYERPENLTGKRKALDDIVDDYLKYGDPVKQQKNIKPKENNKKVKHNLLSFET